MNASLYIIFVVIEIKKYFTYYTKKQEFSY